MFLQIEIAGCWFGMESRRLQPVWQCVVYLQALSDIQIAVKMVQSSAYGDEHPLDRQYNALQCQLQPLSSCSQEYQVSTCALVEFTQSMFMCSLEVCYSWVGTKACIYWSGRVSLPSTAQLLFSLWRWLRDIFRQPMLPLTLTSPWLFWTSSLWTGRGRRMASSHNYTTGA